MITFFNKFQRKLFSMKMRILIYLERITNGKIKKFKITNYIDDNKVWNVEFNKYNQYKYECNKLQYDFLTYLRKDSDKLVVFFNGAIQTDKIGLPSFQRWSWQKDLPYSSIIFSDPTILDMLQSSKIKGNIGWYQGNINNFALNTIRGIVNEFSNFLQINSSNTLFYGSSAGGFSALYSSYLLKGSRACIVNPQINIFDYHKHHSSKILEHLNIGLPTSYEVEKRLNIIELYKNDVSKIPSHIYYKQNLLDTHHYNKHYLPFSKMMKENQKEKNLYTIFVEDDRGHESIPLFEEGLLDIENTFNIDIKIKGEYTK